MDNFGLKKINNFLENLRAKQQAKTDIEAEVNKTVEQLDLSELKERHASIKSQGKISEIFRELSDEEVEKALEKDSLKTKIIESLKKINFKGLGVNDKAELPEPEQIEDEIAAESAQGVDICEAGGKKTHKFNSVSFTAGLSYLAQLSTKATPKVPTIEPPVNWSIPLTDEPTTAPTPEIPEGAIILARAASSQVSDETLSTATITVSSTPQVVVLKNPYTSKNYQYTISLADPTKTSSATFEFLANGRLVVTGDYVKIQANEGQQDDLIIMGNYNEIYTGDEDDIVRLGWTVDGNASAHYKKTGYTGNKINTGAGNDHISFTGTRNTIDMGGQERDTLFAYSSTYSNLSSNTIQNTAVARYNNKQASSSYPASNTLDNLDGWIDQSGNAGCCRVLSIINMLCGGNGIGDLSNYVTINETTDAYTIVFKNYRPSSGYVNNVTIQKSNLSNYNNAYGDIDTVLFTAALEELIRTNHPEYENITTACASNNSTSVKDYIASQGWLAYLANYKQNLLTYYLFGSGNGSTQHSASAGVLTTTELINACNEYINYLNTTEVPMRCFTVYFYNSTNYNLGIVSSHEYAVKNIAKDASGEYYVELVNPWDDADILRFNIEDLFVKAKVGINYWNYTSTQIAAITNS